MNYLSLQRFSLAAAAELKEELPFLQTDLLTEEYFDYYMDAVFGTDRQGVAKGMIEVIL